MPILATEVQHSRQTATDGGAYTAGRAISRPLFVPSLVNTVACPTTFLP